MFSRVVELLTHFGTRMKTNGLRWNALGRELSFQYEFSRGRHRRIKHVNQTVSGYGSDSGHRGGRRLGIILQILFVESLVHQPTPSHQEIAAM